MPHTTLAPNYREPGKGKHSYDSDFDFVASENQN